MSQEAATDPTIWAAAWAAAGAAFTGLGMIAAGYFKYRGQKTQGGNDVLIALPESQRKLIEALMDRMRHLEDGRAQDRTVYERHLEEVRTGYRAEIRKYKEEVAQLRARVTYLEAEMRQRGIVLHE